MVGVDYMLIKDCIYVVTIIICVFSLIMLLFSHITKSRYICKVITSIEIICLVYLILNNYFLPFILRLPLGLEAPVIRFVSFISATMYIFSIDINIIKIKALNDDEPKKYILIIALLLMILPAILLLTVILKQKSIINESDLVVIYSSEGNGGLGDEKLFAYAIGKNSCKQIDLGIDSYYSKFKRFLPKNSIEITNENDISNYNIIHTEYSNYGFSVYKNNIEICNIKNNSHYFNIEFKRGFYINH